MGSSQRAETRASCSSTGHANGKGLSTPAVPSLYTMKPFEATSRRDALAPRSPGGAAGAGSAQWRPRGRKKGSGQWNAARGVPPSRRLPPKSPTCCPESTDRTSGSRTRCTQVPVSQVRTRAALMARKATTGWWPLRCRFLGMPRRPSEPSSTGPPPPQRGRSLCVLGLESFATAPSMHRSLPTHTPRSSTRAKTSLQRACTSLSSACGASLGGASLKQALPRPSASALPEPTQYSYWPLVPPDTLPSRSALVQTGMQGPLDDAESERRIVGGSFRSGLNLGGAPAALAEPTGPISWYERRACPHFDWEPAAPAEPLTCFATGAPTTCGASADRRRRCTASTSSNIWTSSCLCTSPRCCNTAPSFHSSRSRRKRCTSLRTAGPLGAPMWMPTASAALNASPTSCLESLLPTPARLDGPGSEGAFTTGIPTMSLPSSSSSAQATACCPRPVWSR
mmetsp:Transcript_18185/g.57815  ORF Transcript_18185/g.57815 Transcript_18185/m.57815 type:complete len:453 (+) Transcript_18185:690-2048(+)